MINKVTVLSLFISVISLISCTRESSNEQMMQLCDRLFPQYTDSFRFEVLEGDSLSDFFELSSVDKKISIKGNNVNSLAVGLNYYLKNYCHTQVSWNLADSIVMPPVLPALDTIIRVDARCDERFFLNYCTFGYSMPYWQWNEWERAIDWMALNGVTLPLAITGQESIWLKVWQQMGLEKDDILRYFTGPAHLPWHRMSNVDAWQGPLPISWLDQQESLQKKIVARERALGMKPVLPAFAGHVPKELKDKYPQANITTMSQWGGYDEAYRSHFLYPMDSLFSVIQKKFLLEQIKTYGTDHYYGADPFNEVESPSWEPAYLASVSERIYNSLKEVDSDAKWVQMTWMLYHSQEKWTQPRTQAFMEAVPHKKMILLDYYCDSTEVWRKTAGFYNQPFIWNYLGNFGGNTMIAGNIDQIDARIEQLFADAPTSLLGIGCTLEGFDVNPIMYEYVLGKAWNTKIDTDHWVTNWALSRGGKDAPQIVEAWRLMHKKIYLKYATAGQSTLTNARPMLTGTDSWNTFPDIAYDNKDLLQVWRLLLSADKVTDSNYLFDVVNIGRQVLGNQFSHQRDAFTAAYNRKDKTKMKQESEKMISILEDMDRLLLTNSSFLLGKWISDAQSFASNEQEKKYYEENARCILSVWGQKGSQLNDYANRAWAGLISTYYKPRWIQFIKAVFDSLESGKAFDQKEYNLRVKDFEWNWIKDTTYHSPVAQGDAVLIGKELLKKYESIIEKF